MAGGVLEDGRTPADNTTDEQKAVLLSFITEAIDAFDIPEDNIIGHRDLIKRTGSSPKACPCFSVRTWLDELHTDAERLDFSLKAGPAPRGEKLKTTKTYTVREGDTLWAISNTFGVPLRTLTRLNPDAGDLIVPGQKLRLLG
jgi:LysM repeat protein